MIPEKRGANEVSPEIATIFHLKVISRLQEQEGKSQTGPGRLAKEQRQRMEARLHVASGDHIGEHNPRLMGENGNKSTEIGQWLSPAGKILLYLYLCLPNFSRISMYSFYNIKKNYLKMYTLNS